MRCTLGLLPASEGALEATGLPLGLAVHPFAEAEAPLPLLRPRDMARGGAVPSCERCGAFVNPFCRFPAAEGGRAWRCSLCAHMNATPEHYFSPLDGSGVRLDRTARPELCHGSVEYAPPADTAAAHTAAAAFLFVLDVSRAARLRGPSPRCTSSTARPPPSGHRARYASCGIAALHHARRPR